MNLDSYKKSDAMNFGSLVDCLLYTPEEFDNNFIIYPKDAICKSIEENVEQYFTQYNWLKDVDNANNKIIEDIDDFAQWLSTKLASEKAITNKIKTQNTIDKYTTEFYEQIINHKEFINIINEFNSSEGKQKIVITAKDKAEADEARNIIYNSLHHQHFLNLGKSEFQKTILTSYDFEHGREFLKGIIDHFVLDERHQRVYIVDLKCTDTSIMEFRQTVDRLRYDLQAAFYVFLAEILFPADYKINFYWLVYSKKDKQTVVYEASYETLMRGRIGDKWKKGFMELINIYQLSHLLNYPNFNYDYNSTKGFLTI